MKIIRVIFFSLLALGLIACTGIFIFFETFDTDQYLPQITKKASFVLGRQVSIGHVGLGFSSRGITLDIGPLTVADDAGFTTQPFIKVDRVRISLDMEPLILRREIHITDILLQSPQIHFIRSQEGNINAHSIGQPGRPAGDNAVPGNSDRNNNSSGQVMGVMGQAKPGGLFKEHVLFQTVTIRSIRIQDASISFIDQNQNMPLDIWLSNINASLKDSSLSKPFRLSFSASLYSNAPNVHLSTLVYLDQSKRSIETNDLSLQADLSHLDIDQLKGISPGISDNPVLKNTAGVVQLNLAHLEIASSGDILANGDIGITGGVIKNFNIIKVLLSHALETFGGIGPNINLGADDTIIKKAQVKFSLHDKAVFIDDSLIQTNVFELTAQGSVDQGLNTDMQTMLHLNSDISAGLVNEFDGLKYLMDDSKRIAIGASLKGVIPHLKYKPNKDFRKKSKKALISEGENIFRNFLK